MEWTKGPKYELDNAMLIIFWFYLCHVFILAITHLIEFANILGNQEI